TSDLRRKSFSSRPWRKPRPRDYEAEAARGHAAGIPEPFGNQFGLPKSARITVESERLHERPVRFCRQATPSPAGRRPGARSARSGRCPFPLSRTSTLWEELLHDHPFLGSHAVRPNVPATPRAFADLTRDGQGPEPVHARNAGRPDGAQLHAVR